MIFGGFVARVSAVAAVVFCLVTAGPLSSLLGLSMTLRGSDERDGVCSCDFEARIWKAKPGEDVHESDWEMHKEENLDNWEGTLRFESKYPDKWISIDEFFTTAVVSETSNGNSDVFYSDYKQHKPEIRGINFGDLFGVEFQNSSGDPPYLPIRSVLPPNLDHLRVRCSAHNIWDECRVQFQYTDESRHDYRGHVQPMPMTGNAIEMIF